MTRYVVDAATLPHLIETGAHIDSRHEFVAPNLIRSEVLALLLQAVRSGRLSDDVASRHVDKIAEIKMRLLGDRVSRRTAWRLAREQGWDTTSPAEYLAVTRLQADAFDTVDSAVAEVAAALVGVAPVAELVGA
jgi:hypothetical protein